MDGIGVDEQDGPFIGQCMGGFICGCMGGGAVVMFWGRGGLNAVLYINQNFI